METGQSEIHIEPRTGLEASVPPAPHQESLITRVRHRLAKVFQTKPDSEYPIPPRGSGKAW